MSKIQALLRLYNKKKKVIKRRLKSFKSLEKEEYYNEFLFCTLTPQSNAHSCWKAVEEINKGKIEKSRLVSILSKRTRFHNNKSEYILKNHKLWPVIKNKLSDSNIKDLRNRLAETIHGYGMKESSHFLRNIGKSNNQIAILDRHILKNLKSLNILKEDKIKSKRDYLEKEDKFIIFSKKIGIPLDELDLLFWSKENGQIFK
jgi:N-glycosylase/DNA lyase